MIMDISQRMQNMIMAYASESLKRVFFFFQKRKRKRKKGKTPLLSKQISFNIILLEVFEVGVISEL